MVKKKSTVQKKATPAPKKEPFRIQPGLIAVVLIIGLLVAVGLYRNSRRHGESPSGDGIEQLLDVPDPSTALSHLGSALVLGDRLARMAPQTGTTLVRPETITGMDRVLDGADVNALIRLMEKNRIRSLVVDPDLAARMPIPDNTVRHRLALAAPAGRLSATYLTKDFLIYTLTDGAPALTAADRRHLLDIVRVAADVDGAQRPADLSPRLRDAGDWQVILTLRPFTGSHLSFHTVRADTLENAAESLGRRIERHYRKKKFDRKWGPLKQALANRIGLEMEIVYDRGVVTGPRDSEFVWRAFEPGIYGVEMVAGNETHRLPPWYSVTNNLRTVESVLDKLMAPAGKKNQAWKDADMPLWRFRTLHFREREAGGDTEVLYRTLPRVPAPDDITRDALISSLAAFGDWFAVNRTHYTDDRMIYRYFPTKDEENGEYNMVRHALGAYSAALVQEFAPDERHRETAEACMRWMEKRLRWGGPPRRQDGTLDDTLPTWQDKPLPGPDVAILEADENMYMDRAKPMWSNKMGMVAVAILGYTQYRLAGWALGAERERILQGLANFLLYMQKEDGSFHHYYVARENPFYGQQNSIYPGEILYAIARLYGETRDERFRTSFRSGMKNYLDWFKAEMVQREPDGTYMEARRKELVQFQPWIAMSMEEMHRHDPDPSYVEASNLVSLWIIDSYQYDETRALYPDYLGGYQKVLDELPAMHTFVYTEGTAASYMLARRAGAAADVIDKLRKGCLLAARFILQQQIREGENDYYFPNPHRAAGGVRYCLNHSKQRIDYTYHALSSVYRILHAATDEDYAYIAKMALPPEW